MKVRKEVMKIRLWSNNLKVRLIGEGFFNMLFWMYFPFITVYFSEKLGSGISGLLMWFLLFFSCFSAAWWEGG